MAGKIFVNYRREDTRSDAARIRDRLVTAFGKSNVFMDVDNLLAGQRFDQELAKALEECDIFLAVIGSRWQQVIYDRAQAGGRDYVREEIAAALARGITVIPVLIERTPLPPEDWLPLDLRALIMHQKHDIFHDRFGRDVDALIDAIKKARSRKGGSGAGRRWGKISGGVLAAAALAGALFFGSQHLADLSRKAEEATTAAEDTRRAQAEIAAKDEEARGKAEIAAKEQAEQARLSKISEEDAARKAAAQPKAGGMFRDCPECPAMVVVPAGEFTMGSSKDDLEKPLHKVRISKPFSVGKYEVTFDEWDACVSGGGCKQKPKGSGRGTRPVINVSWDDITKEYLPWLSAKTGKAYRLLSEAEWEYTARAGTTTRYAYGNTITTSHAQFSSSKAAEVGSFKPNAFGLYDMHGNVGEWVEDCWNNSYKGAPTDSSAWTSGDCSHRVRRGGSWLSLSDELRSAYRIWDTSDNRDLDIGFRVGRTVTP